MKRQSMLCAAVLGSLIAWSSVSSVSMQAQTSQQGKQGQTSQPGKEGQTSQEGKAKTVQLTGCLEKGTDANTFVLNNAMPATGGKEQSKEQSKHADMKSYQLVPAETVTLAEHVGHNIQVTGQVDSTAGGTAKSGAGGSTAAGKSASMPRLKVTAMKHVSAKCS